VAKGNAFLIKKDIFKNLMWYTLPDSNKQYPLTIERVVKIRSLNQQGVFPEELEPVEVVSSKPKEIEPEMADLVGQISLQTLEKADRKRRNQQQQQQKGQKQGQKPQQAIGNRQQQPGQANKQQGQGQQGNRPRPQGSQGNRGPQGAQGGQQGGGNNQRGPQRPQGPRPPRQQRPPEKGN
jgi:hypothetical protein